MGSAPDTAEMHNIEGTVLRVRQMIVRGTEMTQAVVKTDNDLVTCMWRSAGNPVSVAENSRYSFSGRLRSVDSRRIMVEPSYELVTAKTAASRPNTKSGPKPVPAFIKKLSKKQLIIAGAAAVVVLAVLIPLILGSLSSSNDKKEAAKTAPIVAAPTPVKDLPQAYDASGKPIAATPDDCEVVTVAYSVVEKNDPSMPMGQVVLKPSGANGQDKLCYVHGRGQFPVTTHLKKVVNEIKVTGTKR